ncbi:MAG: O-antigen ligase family protein [Chloroflexota bacterium]|nr:O-antigen ligase family protein [Chloroflexota bacterium]
MSATLKRRATATPLPAAHAPASNVASRLEVLADRLLFAMLLLVLLASPFEIGYPPLGRVLFATFTNLEVTLFCLAGALLFRLGVSTEARRALLKMPLLLPAVALILASVVSTIFGEYKSLGVQFVYRLVMGLMVCASVWLALRGRRRVLTSLGTFVGAALISACIGLLEFLPGVNLEYWLMPFRPQPTTVGGLLRLSGSFEYANGAAVYFEMALPVLLGLAVLFSSRRLVEGVFGEGRISRVQLRAIQVLLFVALGLLAMALILTFSRASWAGVVASVAAFGLAVYLRRRVRGDLWLWAEVWRPLAMSVGVLVLAVVYTYLTHPLLRLRLTGENDRAWYNYALQQGSIPSISVGDVVTVPVSLTNMGPMPWNAERVPKVHLSYHWKSPGGDFYAVFDGLRTALPHDVDPGGSVSVEAVVEAPPKAGEYILEWDLVQEDVTWFYEKSRVRVESEKVRVGEATGQAKVLPPNTTPPVSVRRMEDSDASTVPRGELWRAAFAMFRDHPITGVGPDGFRNLYGRYAGKTSWNRNIYTNNMYIEMFTNLGIVGGLAFLWLVGLALWRTLRNVLVPFDGGNQPMYTAGVWVVCVAAGAALLSFFLHGMVDYFLFSTPLYTIFWFIMAISTQWRNLGIGISDFGFARTSTKSEIRNPKSKIQKGHHAGRI